MSETGASNHTIRALTELRQRILNGELGGGERLFEVAMAEALEISRTPVREAMARLAEEGLLDRAKSGGFVVRSFSFADVIDAIELRGVLEGMAARLAAERGAIPERLAALTDIVARLDACFDEATGEIAFDDYSRLNADYHRALARLAGSEILERELTRATRLPFASPSAFLPDKFDLTEARPSLELAQFQHREILAAIRDREGTRADALAREHARTARRDLEMVMNARKGDANLLPSLALLVD